MPERTHFRWIDGDLLIQLRVSPRASRDEVGRVMGDRLKVFIMAPPVDGKANQHLVKFVAKQFGVPTSQVEVVRGVASRDKTVCVSLPSRLPREFQITKEP